MNTQPFIIDILEQIISSNNEDNNTSVTSSNTLYKEGDIDKPSDVQLPEESRPISHVEAPKTEQSNEIDEEFDLAQAVIYSEILHPKFKDEEF